MSLAGSLNDKHFEILSAKSLPHKFAETEPSLVLAFGECITTSSLCLSGSVTKFEPLFVSFVALGYGLRDQLVFSLCFLSENPSASAVTTTTTFVQPPSVAVASEVNSPVIGSTTQQTATAPIGQPMVAPVSVPVVSTFRFPVAQSVTVATQPVPFVHPVATGLRIPSVRLAPVSPVAASLATSFVAPLPTGTGLAASVGSQQGVGQTVRLSSANTPILSAPLPKMSRPLTLKAPEPVQVLNIPKVPVPSRPDSIVGVGQSSKMKFTSLSGPQGRVVSRALAPAAAHSGSAAPSLRPGAGKGAAPGLRLSGPRPCSPLAPQPPPAHSPVLLSGVASGGHAVDMSRKRSSSATSPPSSASVPEQVGRVCVCSPVGTPSETMSGLFEEFVVCFIQLIVVLSVHGSVQTLAR